MWIFWALGSAVLVAVRRPLEKQTINKLHHFTYAFLVQCVSLPVLAAVVLLNDKLIDPFMLGMNFWAPVICVSVGFYPLNSFLYKSAIQHGELSKVLPLQSLGPVFTLFLAWLVLGEVPSVVAVSGVLFTVLGMYALGLKGKRLHHPLQPFRGDRSSQAMLAAVVLVTSVSIIDKIAIEASNPLFYSLVSSLGAVITLLMAMCLGKQRIGTDPILLPRKLGIIGALQGASYVTYLFAVSSGPVAYVSALRSTNILMGAILGIVIFKERLSIAKLISFFLIITGALLLTLGS